ncbi:hypothetical protein QBC36DRAFT_247045 [Triangularia setosa]|uniref:Myb-like domain-containing protein n=1 Tax=Triangularia setosa TaxID=2587417 RepID=A0AAN7A462_9PEZI|nr:hypothetical protein QBC36DRAFT_247045 [Podospora setosa]
MGEDYWGPSILTSSRAERSKAAVKVDKRRREGLRGKKTSQRQARQLAARDLNARSECGLPKKDELKLFINMMGPRVDMFWPVQDLLPSAAWADSNSDTIKTSQLLLPHDMSFNSTSLINGTDESGSQHSPPSGLGIYDQRVFPMRSGSIDSSGVLLVCRSFSPCHLLVFFPLFFVAAPIWEEQTILGGPSPYVSLCSQSTDPRTNWRQSTSPNVLAESALTNLAYWQHGGPTAAASFVSSHGGDHWDQEAEANTVLMEYNQSQHYTLGHNTLPQTDFGMCHGLPMQDISISTAKAMQENDDDLEYLSNPPFPNGLYDSSSGSFSSTGASDMLEAMALRDSSEPIQSPWPASKEHLGNKTLPCIRPASPHQADTWLWTSSSVHNHLPMFQSCACDSDLPHASSSESMRTSFLAGSSSTSSQPMDIAERHRPSEGRKMLPDRSRPLAPTVLKSNDKSTSHGSKSRRSKSAVESTSPSVRKIIKLAAKPRPPAVLPASSPDPRTSSQSSPGRYLHDPEEEATEAELADRKAKDEFLIVSRQKGLTYKQIRMEGGYTEAESTLRGRYRALTKSREERVRKPEWSEMDLILLERGVRELSPPILNRDNTGSEGPLSAKVPWKKVAEYIVLNGGSYLFGNSTCRKKWDELVREQAALGKDPKLPFFEQNTRAMRVAFDEMLREHDNGYRYGRQ